MVSTNTSSNYNEPSLSAMGKDRPDWRRAHEELSRLAKNRARLDWEEGRLMLLALRARAHIELGFATFAEYIERLFGYAPRWTTERLRVAEALETLPRLDQALRDGTMSWSAVRELTRVAVPENERQWLDIAKGRSQRQIEELVSGHELGDAPGEPSETSAGKRVLRFEVCAETLATFREAMARLRRDSGASLDDDAGLLLMARHVLGGPTDSGRASYQVALTVCEECRRGWQRGAGESIQVGSSVVESCHCDVQHVEQVDGLGIGQPLPNSPSPESPPKRARQDIPPAVRRQVMRRDGGRCVVPGCRNGVFLDIHHIELRSEGGNHDPDALIVICSAHHRAVHRGQLIIVGRVSTGLSFRHADGAQYGNVVEPRAAEAQSEAFRALRALGFREDETRKALQRVRDDTHVGHRTNEVLRAALKPPCVGAWSFDSSAVARTQASSAQGREHFWRVSQIRWPRWCCPGRRARIGAFEQGPMEAEFLDVAAKTGSVANSPITNDANYSMKGGMRFQATLKDQFVTYAYPVLDAGTYSFVVSLREGKTPKVIVEEASRA